MATRGRRRAAAVQQPPPTTPSPQQQNQPLRRSTRERRTPRAPDESPPTSQRNPGSSRRQRRQPDPHDDNDDVFSGGPAHTPRSARGRAGVRFAAVGRQLPDEDDDEFGSPLSEDTPSRASIPAPSRPIFPDPPPRPNPANSKKSKANDVHKSFETTAAGRQVCLFCKALKEVEPERQIASYGKTTATGPLRDHLAREHLAPWVDFCDKFGYKITAGKEILPLVEKYRREKAGHGEHIVEGEERTFPPFNTDLLVDYIATFVCDNDQSINVVENRAFRDILLFMRSELKDSDIPHRSMLRERILQLWRVHVDKLAAEMQEHMVGLLSTTMDMWSTLQRIPFMGATGHWLYADEIPAPDGSGTVLKLTLRTDLLGFLRVPGHYDGEHLCTAFLHIIKRYGMQDKLGWITLDNASNNETFMAALEVALRRENIRFDAGTRRIRCFPHMVNLACKAVIEAISELDFVGYGEDDSILHRTVLQGIERDLFDAVRSIVRVVRISSLRRHQFAEVLRSLDLEVLQLLRDVDTRWSALLLMIERALLLRPGIEKFLQEQELQRSALRDQEWRALELFKDVLSIPHAFQQRLSAEKTPTLSYAIPYFEAMTRAWEKMQVAHPELRNVIQRGLDKLGTYENHILPIPAYTLAHLLNPAMKNYWVMKHRPEKAAAARELLISEANKKAPNVAAAVPTPAPVAASDWAADILDLGILPISEPRGVAEEVDLYIREPPSPLPSIVFWQENQRRFPILAKLAFEIIVIPGSAVPCERVFSSAGETDTRRRNKISPELMEALQMLKFAFRNGRALDFTAGTSKEDKVRAIEEALAAEESVPQMRVRMRPISSLFRCARACSRVGSASSRNTPVSFTLINGFVQTRPLLYIIYLTQYS